MRSGLILLLSSLLMPALGVLGNQGQHTSETHPPAPPPKLGQFIYYQEHENADPQLGLTLSALAHPDGTHKVLPINTNLKLSGYGHTDPPPEEPKAAVGDGTVQVHPTKIIHREEPVTRQHKELALAVLKKTPTTSSAAAHDAAKGSSRTRRRRRR